MFLIYKLSVSAIRSGDLVFFLMEYVKYFKGPAEKLSQKVAWLHLFLSLLPSVGHCRLLQVHIADGEDTLWAEEGQVSGCDGKHSPFSAQRSQNVLFCLTVRQKNKLCVDICTTK